MTLSSFLLFNIYLLLACSTNVAAVESPADESCLLQTKMSSQSSRLPEVFQQHDAILGTLSTGRPVPQFEINLDDPPEERFLEVARHFKEPFLNMFNAISNNSQALGFAQMTSQNRGKEDPELMAEMKSIAELTNVPAYWVHAQQLVGAMQMTKGPFMMMMDRFSKVTDEFEIEDGEGGSVKEAVVVPKNDMDDMVEEYQVNEIDHISSVADYLKESHVPEEKHMGRAEQMFSLAKNPDFQKLFPKFGCTGIIARDSEDGSVWHARNLDFGLPEYLQKHVYNAVYKKGGKEVFTGQMVFPYQSVLTGIRRGPNGYAYSYNSRYGDTDDDTKYLMYNLFERNMTLSGWSVRKTMENVDNYDDALIAFRTTPYPNKEYNLISGVKKGSILARDADGVAYDLNLADAKDDHPYVVMTNYDWIKNDPKEFVADPRQHGSSARLNAQKLLNASNRLSPQVLESVIDDEGVQEPSTIFHAMMSVEHNVYESALPHCEQCDGGVINFKNG